jgi:DNA-binding response OmpR family regulator
VTNVPATVLVVEDDPDLQRMYAASLRQQKLTVATADNGAAGYEWACRHKPDAILSDIMMPQVNGWDLLALVRNNAEVRETRFLLLSHHRDLLERLEVVDAGADDYIEKSATRDEIVQRVMRSLHARREFWMRCHEGNTAFTTTMYALSPATMLRSVAHASRTGKMSITTEWCRFDLVWVLGQIAGIRMVQGAQEQLGDDAMRALLLVDQADVVFDPSSEHGDHFAEARALEPWLLATQQSLNELLEISRGNTLMNTDPLRVQAGLMTIYLATAPAPAQQVATGLRDGKSPASMLEEGVSPMLVDFVVRDLLRKGILSPA